MINIKKALRFDMKFFTQLGKIVVKKHKSHIQKKKLDVRGERYEPYTKAYERRKKNGNAVKSGQTQKSFSAVPDLTLTGDMFKSFKLLTSDSEGFEYGITDPKQANKLIGNQTGFFGKNKNTNSIRRVSTESQPLPKDLQQMITKEMSKQIVRQISKEIRSKGMGVKVYEI